MTGTRTREGGTSLRSKTDSFADQLYYHPSDFDVADAVANVAQARGVTRAQIALAWLLQKPGVTAPIIGTTKLAHLEDAVRAVSDSSGSTRSHINLNRIGRAHKKRFI